MSVISRGIKNAFRNTIRTFSVVVILGISVSLALVMLLAYQTVQAKIDSVKSSIGNTITVTPAGSQGFQGGGNPLTTAQMTTIKGVAHVTNVAESVQDRLTPGTSDTSLASPITAGSLGQRFAGQNARTFTFTTGGKSGGSAPTPTSFTIPLQVTGVSDPSVITSNGSKLTAGALFDGSSSDDVAVIGKDLASKNNLSVGSTFSAYSTTIKVVGIFDSGTTFGDAGIYLPLATEQTLSGQTGDVTSATVTVDTIENVDDVVSAIQSKVGASNADVVSDESAASNALAPLQNIKTISFYSLIGALVAGAVITLLTMMMIVRERRREIGVLKAIGASNVSVVSQFVSEALVLTLLGSVVGVIGGALLSNPILSALVTTSTSTSVSGAPGGDAGRAGGGFVRIAQVGGQLGGGIQNAARTLHATVGTDLLLYGIGAAILIAIIGSAIPAFLIAKVRPAEVMRAE